MDLRRAQIATIAERIWRLRFWVPLTPLGGAVIGAALFVREMYGRNQLDLVLSSAANIALLLVVGAVLFVSVATLRLWQHLRRVTAEGDLNLESGVTSATGFSFPRFPTWPMVQVRLRWAKPGNVAVSLERTGPEFQEVVTPLRRGRYLRVRRRFVVTDVFGFARLGLHRDDEQRLRILPGRSRATGRALVEFIGGDGLSHPAGPATGDMLDMRRYTSGDPLRHIIWKAFARTRQLLVRTPEHSVQPSPSAAAYLVAGREDEATAGTARLFIEDGLLGEGFVFGSDGATTSTADPTAAIEFIIDSARAVGHGAAGLGTFIDEHKTMRERHIVLFVPPTVGPWLDHIERLGTNIRGATVYLAIDDELQTHTPSLRRRIIFKQSGHDRRVQRGLPQITHRLFACGCTVRVLHRPSGEIIPPDLLEVLA